ncbi:MAG: hypothetical protein M1835_007587 [Candelina submexicana]|nr:MAG: hypothetical protein M1835_007587 [Candelina submexicana]
MPTKSPFAGGWTAEKAKKLESIPIPSKIKCLGCKRIRVQSAYSKKQLRDLRDIIYSNGKIDCNTGAYIKCRQCTGQQVNEMTCCVCDEVKGLNGFSKAQRRDPDKARCLDCVAVHVESDPDYEPESDVSNPYEDDGHKSGLVEDTNQLNGDGRNTAGEETVEWFDKLSLTQQNLDNANATATAAASQWSGDWKATNTTASQGGVKLEREDSEYQYRLGAWGERAATHKENQPAGKQYTAYDPQGNAHTRFRAPSTAATSDVLIDLGSPETGRPGPGKGDGRKFAKITAAKYPKKRVVYEYPSSSEEEDDGDDEAGGESDGSDKETDTEDDGTNRSAIGKTKKKALPAIVDDDDDDDDDYMKAI